MCAVDARVSQYIWESEWDTMVLDDVDSQIQQLQTDKALARDNDVNRDRV